MLNTNNETPKKLVVLGIRGLPAAHGGFETFAEHLCKHLKREGWDVTVYCQEEGKGKSYHSEWLGINLVHIPVSTTGTLGTVVFDIKSILHSLKTKGIFLTLGYNTAVFNVAHRLAGKVNVINMDGLEWKRDKWNAGAKAWFWLNERIGCLVGSHLIADPEPENSILEIVRAFSRSRRNHKLVVLGNYLRSMAYHEEVLAAASEEVIFLGAIYDASIVGALRFFSRFYIHGHRVGGTNPSLVEALGAGCAIIAQDNHFNRWVAGPTAAYFRDESECGDLLDALLPDEDRQISMSEGSHLLFHTRFRWADVLSQYQRLLEQLYPEPKLNPKLSRSG
jgi:glycosyltransferase involved in cell wall biosynthesis